MWGLNEVRQKLRFTSNGSTPLVLAFGRKNVSQMTIVCCTVQFYVALNAVGKNAAAKVPGANRPGIGLGRSIHR
jgi:hypothetical protein